MAAGQSVQVTLGFKADTSGAKQAIQELNAQLNKIQASSLDNLGINRELQEASQAAKVLQQNLQAALDVKTGQINITTFAKNLTNAGTSVTQLGQKLMAAGTSGQMAFAQLGRSIAAMDVPLKQTNATLQNMMTTLKNTAKWELSSNLVHGIESAFSNALNYSKQLNQSLTDIRIVSGASADDMARFAVEANTAAKALGTTTKAYADAAKIYYQQGDSATQAAKKAEITLKATNAAFKANASEMSEMLTAVWNSFQVGADQLESYVDVMANLGAHTATSMEEIATAMQKVAATSNTVGVSMEQMSAMIATVSSATRLSAETIGTSMNTILSRIGGLKLGETLEDGVDLNKYSKALKSVGIDVLTASGQLRSMGTVIEELGNKWTTLSTAQQSALAQTIGGARQYTNLMALFSNWDKYQINLDLAINSDGALEKMQETFMQGWEGATAKMKASLEGIYQTLIDDQGMIDFTNSLAGILDSVNNIIQSFGGLEGVLTQLGAIGVQVFSKQIGEGIANSITKMTTFISSFQQLHLIDGKGWSDLGGWGKMQHAMTAIGMNTNERLYNQTTNQAASLLRDAKDAGDLGLNSQITASQILIDKKLELQSVENQLTESQKKQAQAGLAQLTAQVNEVDRLAQAYQETETNLRATNRSLTSYNALQEAAARNQTIKSNQALQDYLKSNPTAIKTVYDDMSAKLMRQNSSALSGGNLFGAFTKESLANVDSALGTLVTRYENLNRAMTLVETQGSKFSESLRAMSKPGAQAATELGVLTQSLNQTKDNMQQMGASTAIIEQWQAKLEAAAQKGPTEFTAALRTVTDEAHQMGQKLQASSNAALDILAGKLGLSRDALLQAGEQAGLSADQMARLAQALGLVGSQADAIPMKVSKVVTSLQQITRMAGAMAGAFTSAFNTIANWDTSNLTSKVMGITSTLTQSISAVGSGAMLGASIGVGPYGKAIGAGVGALVGLAGTIVGIVMGNAEKEAKAKAAQLNKDFKTQQEVSSKTKEEITSAKDLITTYNTLYATYLKTGEGQSELLETALQIAEAYGIQGAAVLAMSGNFEKFNEVIRENLHYTDLLTAAETQAASSREQMTNAAENLNTVIGGTIRNSDYGSYKLNDLQGIASISSFNMPTETWMNLPMTDSNVQAWMTNMANLNGSASGYYSGWGYKDSVAKLLVQAFMDNDKFDLSADILRRSSGYTGDWGSAGVGRWTNFAAQNGDAISQIYAAFPDELSKITLGEFILGSHYIDNLNGFGLPFLDQAPGLSGGWVVSGLKDKNSRLISSMPSAWLTAQPSEHYATISGWFNEDSPYAHLINDQGGIQVSTTDPYQLQADLELIATWDQQIGQLIEDTEEGSTERQLLTNLRDVLQKVKTTKIKDSDQTIEEYATQAVEDANKWTEILTLQSSVTSMFGRNEKNTKFSDYTTYVGDLNHLVELNYKNMDEFEKFHGMELEDIQTDQALLKEFNQLRDKAVLKTIQDTTGFTDYVQMYRMIINTFDTNQLPDVNQFIDKHELTSMSTTTASALKQFMDHGNSILDEANSTIIDAILAADSSLTDASESTLTKYQNAKSSLKKDMSQEESQKIYDAFFGEDKTAEDGTTWEQFIQMNYEARENWIDQMIAEARTNDRERYKQLKQNSEEARDIWGEQIAHDYSQEAFDLLTNNYDRLSAAYTQYSTSMLHYFDTTATGFKLKDNLDEELPSWVINLLNGRTTIKADEFGNAFGGFLATQKDSFGNAIFTEDDIKLLTQGQYSFDQLMSAYAVWLSYDEEARNAQTLIDILDGTGEAAEGATEKVKRLVSAFKSLPTTSEDMTKLLGLVNEYNKTQTKYDVNAKPPTLFATTEEYDAWEAMHQVQARGDYTASELIDLYHNNRAEYETLMINSIKHQISQYGDEDGLLTEQLYAVEAQHMDTLVTTAITPLNQALSDLQSQFSNLNNIDVTALPAAGTTAYIALKEAIEAAGLSFDEFLNKSDKDQIADLYTAREHNLEEQQRTYAAQAAAYDNAYADSGFDFSAIYEANKDKAGKGIEQITDPTFLAAYQKYVELREKDEEISGKIAENTEDEQKALNNLYSGMAKQVQARQQTKLQDANKEANAAQVLLNASNGELTAVQKANLTAQGIDISSFEAATTAATRATKASEIYARSVQTVSDAYTEQNTNIDAFLNKEHQLTEDLGAQKTFGSDTGTIFRQYLQNAGFDDTAIAEAMAAYQTLQSQGLITAATTNAEVWSMITTTLTNSKTANEATIAALQATAIDAIGNVYQSMAQEAQQAAADQISLWQSTFQTIAGFMKSALSGTLLQDVTSSWDNYFAAYLNSTYGQNHNISGFSSALVSGSFKSSDFILPTYDSNAILTMMGLGDNGLFNDDGQLLTYSSAFAHGQALARQNGLTDENKINAAAERYTTQWFDMMLAAVAPEMSATARATQRDLWKSGQGQMDQGLVTRINNGRADIVQLAEQYGLDVNTATSIQNVDAAVADWQTRHKTQNGANASNAQSSQNTIGQIIQAMESGDTYEQAVQRLGLSPAQIAQLTEGYTSPHASTTVDYWKGAWGHQNSQYVSSFNAQQADLQAERTVLETERKLLTGQILNEDGTAAKSVTLADGTVLSYTGDKFLDENSRRIVELDQEIAALDTQIQADKATSTYDSQNVTNSLQKINAFSSALTSLPTDITSLNNLVSWMNAAGQTINGETITAANLSTLAQTDQAAYRTAIIAAAKAEAGSYAEGTTERLQADAQVRAMEKQDIAAQISEASAPVQNEIKLLQEAQSTLQNLDLAAAPAAGTEAYSKLAQAIEKVNQAAGKTKYTMDQLTKGNMIDRITSKYAMQKELLMQQAEEQAKIVKAYEDHYDFENSDYTWDTAIARGETSEYQAYLDAQHQQEAYQSEARATDDQARTEKMNEYTAAFERQKKQMEDAQKNLTKLQNGAQEFSNAVESGMLSATSRATLAAAGMDDLVTKFDQCTSAAERADVAAEAWSRTLTEGTEALAQQNGTYQEASTFMTTYGERMAKNQTPWTSAVLGSKQDFLDRIKDMYKLDDSTMGAIGEAYDAAKAKFDPTIDPSSFISEMQNYLSTTITENNEAWAQISAGAVDSMKAAYQSMNESARTAAQQQVEIWKNAFDQIAGLMQNLASGESLASSLANNPDLIRNLMIANGWTADDIRTGIANGTIGLSDLSLPKYSDRAQYMKAHGFDILSQGGLRSARRAYGSEYGRTIEAYDYTDASGAKSTRYRWAGTQIDVADQGKAASSYAAQQQFNQDLGTYTAGLMLKDTDIAAKQIKLANGKLVTNLDGLNTALREGNQEAWNYVREQANISGDAYQLGQELGQSRTEYEINKADGERQIAELQKQQQSLQAAAQMANEWNVLKDEDYAGMTTQDKIDSMKEATGIYDNQKLLDMLNAGANTAYATLEDFFDNVSVETLATTLQSSSMSFAQTVVAAGQAFAEAILGSEFASEADKTAATDLLNTLMQNADTAAQTRLQAVMNAGNWKSRGDMEHDIEDRAWVDGTANSSQIITKDTTDDELAFWGEATIDFDRTSAALDTLHDALTKDTGAFDVLTNAAKHNPSEILDAITTLRSAVEDFFGGVDVSAEWIDEHLPDIKEWANGSVEAMERLERALLDVFNDNLTTKFSDTELDELNGFANELKFGEQLSEQQLEQINNLIKMKHLTADQIKQLGDILGITFDINQEQRAIPRDLASVNATMKAIAKESTVARKAADLVGLMRANAKAFQGYKDIQDASLAKQQAINDAVEAMGTDAADAIKIAQATMEIMDGHQYTLDIETSVDTSELDAFLNNGNLDLQALVTYLADTGNLDKLTFNEDGTITYHAEGGDVNFTMKPTPDATSTTNASGSGTVRVGPISVPFSYEYSSTATMSGEVPVMEGASVNNGTGNRGGNGANNKPSGGGGGGGGGSKKKNYEDKKRTDDTSDRYHEVTKQLEHMSNKLEKIDKLKTSTWGKNHIQAINDEIAAIKEENQVQQEYLEEAQAYYNQHKQMLEAMGAQIDENGVVTNYEELMDQWTAEYNAAVEHYNSLTAEQQEKESSKAELNEAEETYNQRMQLLEELEEDASLLETIQNDILENQNKISAAIAEGITYKIEFQFDYDERELAALDQWIERYESKLAHQDDTWEKLKKKQDIYFTIDDKGRLNGGELYYLQEQYAELQRQYNDGKGDLNAADYAELLKDLEERIRDTVSSIEELRIQMSELYGNTLDLAKEELERYTNQIDHMVSSAEALVELQGLMGKGDSASAVLGLYETQYKASEANLQQSRTWMENIRSQRDQIQAEYDAQIAALGPNATAEQMEEINQLYKPMLDKANEELMDAEDTFYENWKETAEKAQALFEKQVDAAIEKFDEAISSFTGTDFDFDQLESDYEYYTEAQERYLSTSKELYEVSKLNRQINQSISDATTKASKERLKALQEVINKQAEENRLTEYDVEMMQLQYKHALALQELEEKQNAKSVVRLTRDENGNYGYQYTADDSDVNDAKQKVEDALQEINELSAKRVAELEQEWISSERDYRDKLKEIAADTSLTIEERQAKMAELTERHQEKMLFLQQQYGNASEALLTNQQYVQERYGKTILENTEMIQDQMNSLAGLALLSSGDYAGYLEEQLQEGGSLWQALHQHIDNTASIAAAAGTTWEDAVTGASDYNDTLNDLQTTLEQTNRTMQTTTQNILDYVAAWTQSEGVMQTLLNDAEALAAAMRGEIGDENDDVQDTQVGAEGPTGTNKKHYMYAWGYRGWFGDQAGYDSSTAAKAAAYNDIEAFFENLKITEDSEDADASTINAKYEAYIAQAKKTVAVTKYAAGGLVDYTGPAWVDGTVTQPELMLNASDTQKILQAVDFVRMLDDGTLANIQAAIAQNTLSMLYTLGSINAPTTHYKPEELQQNVQISAEFPNATDHNEIAQAFDDLINLATQYAHRK